MTYFILVFQILQMSNPVDIVIDPGHGGTNLGAKSIDKKTHEKQLTLDFSLKISGVLNKLGVKHKLTRRKDKYLTLLQRVNFAKKYKPKCFISIHFNSSPLHNRRGIEIFYPNKIMAPSVKISTSIINKGINLKNKNKINPFLVNTYITQLKKTVYFNGSLLFAKKISWRLYARGFNVFRVREGNYDVIQGVDTKSILFEGGFLDHKIEGKLILKEKYRIKLAKDLVRAMVGICTKKIKKNKLKFLK
jgi:N-acetylmuramoyl-L-alanine amidase